MSINPENNRRRLALPTIIDVEASGFGTGSYPIEIGFIDPAGATTCMLIRPESDWTHWDPSAEAVHHITRAVLMKNGRTASEVAQELNRQLANITVYTDAWGFDLSWIGKLFDHADMAPSFRLEDLRCLLNAEQLSRWDAVKAAVVDELKITRHRASSDARILQLTYARVTLEQKMTQSEL